MSRTFKIFGKKTCRFCPGARHKVEYFVQHWNVDVPVIYYDLDAPDGMAEGAWYDVYETPTVVLEEGETIVKRWVKIPPLYSELFPMFRIPGREANETVPGPA